MDGFIIIKKEKDYTSRDVVNLVGKYLHTKKVGHTGTLDPLATGVLVVCVGKATKLVEYLTATTKEYIAEVELGTDTDTLDNTGTVKSVCKAVYSESEIDNALAHFQKSYLQEVPIYSAVKVNGRKLYEYAREGKEVELPKKEVTISSIKRVGKVSVVDDKTIFSFKCTVSKGTYIRSLIRDIAAELNTVGVMINLMRTKQGKYKIEDAITLEELKEGMYQLHSIYECLEDKKMEVVDGERKQEVLNGKLLKYDLEDELVFVDKDNSVLALYTPYEKMKGMIKPEKMFMEQKKEN